MAELSTFVMMVSIMVAPFGLAAVLGQVARRSARLCRALRDYPYTNRMVVAFFGDDAERWRSDQLTAWL